MKPEDLTDTQRTEIKNAIDNAVAQFIADLPCKVSKLLNKGVAGIIGLSDEGHRVRIDHCNGNRGLIGELIRENVTDSAKKQIESVVKAYIPTLSQYEPIHKGMQDEALEIYKRELRSQLNSQARAQAQFDVAEFFKNNPLEDIVLGPKSADMDDPNSFDGPLGDPMLQRKVKNELGIDVTEAKSSAQSP